MDTGGRQQSDEEIFASLERDDAYQVVKVLAQKGPSSTELVRLPGENLRVRKRIPLELANERAWTALLNIRDPYLPRVREVYRLPDQLVVVCDYIEGMSLGELVNAVGRLEPFEALRRLRELCHAAGVLHAHDIVHRDISPGNAIVSSRGTHLIDLGNARTYSDGARHDTTLLGTYGFASPEQYGFAQTDARSDIYSLGRLFAYMLTGVLPSDVDFDEAFANDAFVPPELRAVIDRACAFEPSARYQSADELARSATEALEKEPGQGERPPQRPHIAPEPEGVSEPPAQDGPQWAVPPVQGTSQRDEPSAQGPVGEPFAPSADVSPTARQSGAGPTAMPQPLALGVPPKPHAETDASQGQEAEATTGRVRAFSLVQDICLLPSSLLSLPALVASSWKRLPWGKKALLLLFGVLLFFGVAVYLSVGFGPYRYGNQSNVALYPIFAVLSIIVRFAITNEIVRFLLDDGIYAGTDRKVYLLKRIFGWVGFWFLAAILASTVVAMIRNAAGGK